MTDDSDWLSLKSRANCYFILGSITNGADPIVEVISLFLVAPLL